MAKANDVRIRFLQAYTVQDHEQTHYEEGQVETMNEASAAHFVNRGVAEYFDEAAEKAEKAAKAKAAKAKAAKAKAAKSAKG